MGEAPLQGLGLLGQIRTDLAVEARDRLARTGQDEGIDVEEEERGHVHVRRVHVRDARAARRIGKSPGTYTTIEAAELRARNPAIQEAVARITAEELRRLLPLDDEATVFVVGLGNAQATPDALGPRVVRELLVTRGIESSYPAEVRQGMRSVAALAPGVLGTTGIETGEVILGVAARIRPDALIVIDALAAGSLERLATTVQIADTGIEPGSGIGNAREPVTRERLGVPVVAIGVPMVVRAFAIALETLERTLQEAAGDPLPRARRGAAPRPATPPDWDEARKRQVVESVVDPAAGDLMVTPKEVDLLVDDLSKVLAAALNVALHPRFQDVR
ncbi:MAG: GPR endopeptidase, partial [Bacillota bacterium]|nr:GPR endopeptidase [Bacillota bacterium]